MASSFAGTLRAFANKPQPEPARVRSTLGSAAAQGRLLTAAGSLPRRPERIARSATATLMEKPAGAQSRLQPRNTPLLARAWKWLQKQHAISAKKQLRVSETVSLGEKRFVAVVQAGGQRFLVGGGSSGVSLLAELDRDSEQDCSATLDAGDAAPVLESIARAGGR